MQKLITALQKRTTLKKEHIENILKMLADGATIPFIARYRKELTGGASDETLREFELLYGATQNLLKRKEEVLRLIDEKGLLSEKIRESIGSCDTLVKLEDIYAPFKEKKSSRASKAIALGLSSLAATLMRADLSIEEFRAEAKKFKNIAVDEAIAGAQDIVAERYSENIREREAIRNSMLKFGVLEIKKGKNFQEDSLYKNFVNKSEKVAYIPSHRYLALMRGVEQKELSVKIEIDREYIEGNIKKYKIPSTAKSSKSLLFAAYKDGLKRLLLPSISREVHNILKERSDDEAIKTFGKNLEQLLMTPPTEKGAILGVDPAFRSGCKLAVIDENANYLASDVIFPTAPQNDLKNAILKVKALHKKYKIEAVAIGNGTASRETQEFFAKLNEEIELPYTVVSEAGASVYSASKLAAEEYPHLDVTIRGAINIAQRVRDPMATLVKIDPKSLGIGQYQHDVDQKKLLKKLDDVIEDVVNRVGVDINSASVSLLSHIAGITKTMAKNIVLFREERSFSKKEDLLKVKGIGAKAYEQAAGFIRIKNSKNRLDNSGVHPESFIVAQKLEGRDLKSVDIQALAKEFSCGVDTLKDIIHELLKPGFDPRKELDAIPFQKGLVDIKMLKEGSFVSGVVRSITDFGAFIDIGLKNDGFIHISKMSQKRIKHPFEILALNQYLAKLEVLSVDYEKMKVSLALVE